MELNFEQQFKYALVCCRFTGLDPYQPRNRSWALRFLALHGTFTLITCLHLYTVMTVEYDADYFMKVCPNISFIIVYGYNTANYLLALTYQNKLTIIMDRIKLDFEIAKQLLPEEKAVVVEYAKKGHFVSKLWAVFSKITICSTMGTTILITLYDKTKGEQLYDCPTPVYIPGTSSEFRRDLSLLEFLVSFFLFTLFSLYAATLYTAVCPLGPIFMLHASGQLELLRIRLMQLYLKHGSVLTKDRMMELKNVAIQLQEIYDFVNHIKTSHKLMLEVTLKGTAIIVPVLLYQMMKTLQKGEYRIIFPFWLTFGAILLSSIPCYYADILMGKSAEMREALYMCKWETQWEKRVRSSLLLMMTRTTRLVAIDSIFRVACLEALTETCRLAFTLFNAMNTLL